MKNSYKIKKIVMITILSCLAVILQLFSNYVPIGTVNITLALIPIVVGAILYGPLAGFKLELFVDLLFLWLPQQ